MGWIRFEGRVVPIHSEQDEVLWDGRVVPIHSEQDGILWEGYDSKA